MPASWRSALSAAVALSLLLLSGGALALDEGELAELEGLLRSLGFDPGAVDGVVDADTTAAIQRYQNFALLPGPPEPTAQLLDELRGVAAAFTALSTSRVSEAPAEAEAMPPDLDEKPLVPPPPPPPKLSAPPEPEAPAAPAEETAEAPAEAAPPDDPPGEPPRPEAPVMAALPDEPAVDAPAEDPAEPEDSLPARIEAELLRFRHELAGGSLTPEDLARQFNSEGRKLLQQADYGAAILKFSVAIHLDPDFAGAYSNRGTAYRHQDEADLAEADFAKAKELGFGGFRLRDSDNPLN